jgi:hypothetical protein
MHIDADVQHVELMLPRSVDMSDKIEAILFALRGVVCEIAGNSLDVQLDSFSLRDDLLEKRLELFVGKMAIMIASNQDFSSMKARNQRKVNLNRSFFVKKISNHIDEIVLFH